MPQGASAALAAESAAETRLAAAAAEGVPADLSGLDPEARTVRGAFIRALLLDQLAAGPARGLGLRARGLRIAGPVDLSGLGREGAPLPPLALEGCDAVEPDGIVLDIAEARLVGLAASDCALAYIRAAGATSLSTLALGFCRVSSRDPARDADAALDLKGIHVEGSLDLYGLKPVDGRPSPYLDLDRAVIARSLFLGRSELSRLDLIGAQVGGDLMLQGAKVLGPASTHCLVADRLRCAGNVMLDGGRFRGAVRLLGARIGGQLSATPLARAEPDEKGRTEDPALFVAEGDALVCEAAEIGASVFLSDLGASGGLRFVDATIRGSLNLDRAEMPQLRLAKAQVTGDINLRIARVLAPDGQASVNADSLRCEGSLILDGGTFRGEIRLVGARIARQLNATPHRHAPAAAGEAPRYEAAAIWAEGDALSCDSAEISGGVFMTAVQVRGTVRFIGARLASFNATPGPVTDPRSNELRAEYPAVFDAPGDALAFDRCAIRGGVFMRAAQVRGTFRLPGASIDGQFNLNLGATAGPVPPPPGDGAAAAPEAAQPARPLALLAVNSRFRDTVSLDLATLRGTVDLDGAQIAGNLSLVGARLGEGGGAPALNGNGLAVAGDVLFGVPSERGRLHRRVEPAEGRARVAAGVDACGMVALNRAEIGGALVLNDALFRLSREEQPGPDPGVGLALEQARIRDRIEVHGLHPQSFAAIDLRGAATDLLDDLGGRGWGEPCAADQPPEDGRHARGVLLLLSGLAYARLPELDERSQARGRAAGASVPERRRDRLAFLMRQFPGAAPRPEDFNPQPFEQLVRVLRASGHPEDADWFAREKRRFRTRCRVDRWLSRAWQRFLGLAFGHFYSPGRALATALVALALGMALVIAANEAGAFVAKRRDVDLTSGTIALLRPADRPPARPPATREPCWRFRLAGPAAAGAARTDLAVLPEVAVIALDALMPLFNLKLDRRCEIDDAAPSAGLWSAGFVAYSLLGLVLIPLFIATVSGLARRD